MRITASIRSSLAAAAIFAATTPAAAQQSVAPNRIRPVVGGSATDAPHTRTLAVYEFDSTFDGVPSRVIVADSAGTLVASFRVRSARSDRPMKVGVADRDILLQGETVRGTITLVLFEQNDPSGSGTLLGSWALGSRQGELRGRTVR